jgi:hypothetical protein
LQHRLGKIHVCASIGANADSGGLRCDLESRVERDGLAGGNLHIAMTHLGEAGRGEDDGEAAGRDVGKREDAVAVCEAFTDGALMVVGGDNMCAGDDTAAGIFGDSGNGADGELSGEGQSKRDEACNSTQAAKTAHSKELQKIWLSIHECLPGGCQRQTKDCRRNFKRILRL